MSFVNLAISWFVVVGGIMMGSVFYGGGVEKCLVNFLWDWQDYFSAFILMWLFILGFFL